MALDSTLQRHDSLMPQRPGGLGKGTAMALLVHIGLLIALAFGVSWRSQTPAGVSAELWSAVPQIAAPPAAPQPKPAPTPPAPTPKPEAAPPKPTQAQIEAQIAIEKEKAERKQRELREQQEMQRKEQERKERERKEQERIEREKAQQLAAQKQRELEAKRQKEDEARQAKQREENLKRIQSQAGTGSPDAAGTAVRESGPSASYAGRIIARVKPNIVLTDEVPGNPTATVEVRCAPDGTVVSRRLVKSSGNKDWDEAVLRAIDRTGELPRDIDGRVPSSIVIDFRPRD